MRKRSSEHIRGDLAALPDGRRISYIAVGPEHGDSVLYFHGSRLDAIMPKRPARARGRKQRGETVNPQSARRPGVYLPVRLL